MKATKNINIYLIDKKPVKVIDVVQYDTGIQLVFTVKDFGIPSEATATLYVQKPSGKFVYQTDGITISGDTVTINLDNQALTEYGKVPYQVTITSGSDTVTSFAGLMLVDRSLKDAGATESRTVIRAFDEVTVDEIAEFQASARTIADAVIATIPDDYTELTAKVNESANAIKGHLSGAVVRADDVSPVEHLMNVKVYGKNILPYPYKQDIATAYGGTFTAQVNGGILASGTPTDYVSLNLYDGKPIVKSGNFVFSASGNYENVSTTFIIYDENDISLFNKEAWKGAAPIRVNLDDYPEAARWLVFIKRSTPNVEMSGVIYPQIEINDTATEYTPYIDPSTVTVTRCGKNLVDISNAVGIGVGDKITIENNSITISAGSAVYGVVLMNGNACLKKGVTYTLSCNLKGQHHSSQWGWRLIDENDKSVILSRSESLVYTPVDNIKTVYFYFSMGEELAENSTISNVQIETSEVVTEYEPYNGTEYTPNADGTINGLTSVSPTMTLLTDTDGVIVECEYNKDTNKVIQKFAEALGITI